MPRWDFERRREAWSYKHMLSVAITISDYISEYGPNYNNPRHFSILRSRLQQNTGYDWPPKSTPYLNVFRNYNRLFKSFGIATVQNDNITLLPVGRWLVAHEPTSEEYYARIVDTFRYPNAAFISVSQWVECGRVVSPLMTIIRCLRDLEHKVPANTAHITPEEVLQCLYEAHDGLQSYALSNAILSYRMGLSPPPNLPRCSNNVDDNDRRQVREIIAYLKTAGCVKFKGTSLNRNTLVMLTDLGRDLGLFEPEQVSFVKREALPEQHPLEFIEGRIYNEERRLRRRNPRLRPEALKHYGLICSVCRKSFEFLEEIGARALDVHHSDPLSELNEARTITLKDVKVVCAVCHRIIHTKRPPLTIDEARALLMP